MVECITLFGISDHSDFSRSSGLSESLLLSCLDDFLVLHDFIVELDLWDGRDPFAKIQLSLPPLDSASVMLRDWPCPGHSPLVCFACRWKSSSLVCRWLCSCLACCWLCSSACRWLCSSACCWLCSSLLFSFSLQIFVFFSLSSYSCCFPSIFSPLARWLWCRLGFSPLAPWLWFLLRFSLTTGFLAVVPSELLLQSHFVVGYDSVARFWLPPAALLSVASFVINGSR